MTLIDMRGQVFSADKAKEVAQQLQESDPSWVYEVETSPDGKFARVKVYDENLQFVGRF